MEQLVTHDGITQEKYLRSGQTWLEMPSPYAWYLDFGCVAWNVWPVTPTICQQTTCIRVSILLYIDMCYIQQIHTARSCITLRCSCTPEKLSDYSIPFSAISSFLCRVSSIRTKSLSIYSGLSSVASTFGHNNSRALSCAYRDRHESRVPFSLRHSQWLQAGQSS